MAKQVQKDRYIHLDGTPVEAKGLWRHVSPLCLAVTFGAAALCHNYYDVFPHQDPKDTPTTPVVEAALGLIFARFMRECLKHSFGSYFISSDKVIYDKYVIDIKPDKHTRQIDLGDELEIKETLWSFSYPMVSIQSYAIIAYGLSDSVSTVSIVCDSITHAHRLHKLHKGDWVIIDRDKMKKVEEDQKEESSVFAPLPA